ncbi:protein lethal(2)denticleless isoform X2 [Prorops nasuta]|uniref:protein lethal(2)denticleless isoform X2 n=1 Tax=Prorops nasuta TaxID=863751 RepID=UPI0034CF8B59
MNIVHSIVRRQEGFDSICDYDIALYRLKCYSCDVFRGITPNTNALDYNPEPPVFACRFCPTTGYEHILALANEDGKIALQNTVTRKESSQRLAGIQAHCNAIFDIAWMPGELKLITASGDHTTRLWDVSRDTVVSRRSSSSVNQIDCFHAHTRSVKTAVFRYQDKGARDGAIMVWDIRANHINHPKPDNSIFGGHSIGPVGNTRHRRSFNHASRAQSITGLAFQDDFTLISCAAGDGLIKVWDLRKNYTVHKKDPVAKHIMNYTGHSTRNGFSSLLVCPARITLYASCMDNIIYAYNISSFNPKPIAEYFGHQNTTFYVKTCLSRDGRYLASGSSDDLAYIWNTRKPGAPIVKLSGHTEEVTCIAWCNDGEAKIVTCSDDSYHRIWRIGSEYKIENEEVLIRGQAEQVINLAPLDNLKLETTPTVSGRWIASQETTPVSDSTPVVVTPGPSCIRNDGILEDNCYERQQSNSSAKRNYVQMTHDSFKSILSPIQENKEPLTKRFHSENRGARRLFSPANDQKIESYETNNCRSNEVTTSAVMAHSSLNFSPTLNLPNFVIDGTAPHLLQISPQKCKENIDWLTKIRKERYEQKAVRAVSEKASSPKTQITPARRNSRSKSTEPQKVSKVPRSPGPSLLDYFKISTKDCDKSLCSDNNRSASNSNSVP